MHFWVTLAFLILGRTPRMDQRDIDDNTPAQRKAPISQVAVSGAEDADSQFMPLQQTTEIEDGGFVGYTLQAQIRKLSQYRSFIQHALHRCIQTRSASDVCAALPSPDRPTTLTFGSCGRPESPLPWQHLIHFDQKESLAVCLCLPAYLASAKIICFIGRFVQTDWGISADSRS